MKTQVLASFVAVALVGCATSPASSDELLPDDGGPKSDVIRPFGTFDHGQPDKNGDIGISNLTLNEDHTAAWSYELVVCSPGDNPDTCHTQSATGTFHFYKSGAKRFIELKTDPSSTVDADYSLEYVFDPNAGTLKLAFQGEDSDGFWWTLKSDSSQAP
jgi:hypothetical protein